MTRQRDECFVLDTFALGEADLIVTLWGREHGKVRAVAPSARRSRRRFGGALEPLSFVHAEWVERPGRELGRLETLDCLRSYAALQAEPAVQATCAVLREITLAFGHEGQSEPAAFRLLGAVLDTLEAGGDAPTLIRYYEYWVLRLHGLAPELDACAWCARPLAAGRATWIVAGVGLRCADCRPGAGQRELPWTAQDRETAQRLATLGPRELGQLARCAAGGALEILLRGALEGFAERRFRAYRHLGAG